MAFNESISEYLSLNCTFGVFLCMLGYCVVTLIWFIILIGASDVVFLLSLAILFLPDYFAHFICVDSLLYVVWLAVLFSLACILSWSSFEHDVCIIIRPDSHSFLRGHEWYILYSAWLYVAWLPFLCMIACCLSMWAAYLSPYLQLSWFRSFFSSWFSLLQVWDLLCACSLTELEIRSKV